MSEVRRLPPRAERTLAALVGLSAFVVYVLTAYTTVPGGDSGELIGAVASGGVIHPPGYPLYALLGGVFVHLPLGSLAFRLGLLSALCGALAAGFLARAVTLAARSLAAGISAGVLFAFAPGVWRYAIAAEVFALNDLVLALLLWLAVRLAIEGRRGLALAGAFVLGLGLSNHHTILFTGIPVVLWALAAFAELRRPRALAELAFAGALGLLPYLYLPLLASHHGFVTWGAADTWDGFWTHVLRREYGTFSLSPAGVGADVPATLVLSAWAEHTVDQLRAPGLVLSLLGAAAALREGWRRPSGLGLLVFAPVLLSVGIMMALGNLPLGSPLFREILARFWQQPDLYLAALAGVGVAVLEAFAGRFVPRASVVVTAAAVAIGVTQAGRSYAAMDRHKDHVVEQYGAEMLRVAPPNAILVTKGDLITNTIRYVMLSHDARARPDVRLVDQELLATPWGPALFAVNAPGVVLPPRPSSLKQLFDANRGPPILVCGGLAPGDHSTDATYGLWPLGFCDEVHAGDEPVSMDDWIARSEAAVPHVDFTARATNAGAWEEVVWSDTWEVRQARAAHILTVVGANPGRQKYLPVAVRILQEIVDANPAVPARVHKNLAIAIGRAGITTPEQKAHALRAWEGYLEVAPPDDPQLPAIRKEVQRLRQ